MLVILLMLTLFSGTSATTLTTNLVAYYPFNGNAQDMSGNNHHGTVRSVTLAPDQYGTANSAYAFNGAGCIEIIDGSVFNFVNPFTISLWIKMGTTQVDHATIMSKSHGVGGFNFAQNGASTNLFHFGYYYAPNVGYAPGSVQFTANVWSHFVVTKIDTTIKFYKDNALIVTGNAPTASVTSNGVLPLMIGAWNQAASQPASIIGRYMNCVMDELRFYSRAFSEAEIAELFVYGSPTTQPTLNPTVQLSLHPSLYPSLYPTTDPTPQPTVQPSATPTSQPSSAPSCQPSDQPSVQPSVQPSNQPSTQPLDYPTSQPTGQPSVPPSAQPTCQPVDSQLYNLA